MDIPADDKTLDLIYRNARTHTHWKDKTVDEALIKQAYELMRMGPTSANCCPLRVLFLKTKEGKERLKPCLDEGNVEKTMLAPVTAIFAYDLEFYEKLPKLFPHADARSWFAGKDTLIQSTAFRNSTLQAAYFLLALRACGLDCGPMSGFDNKKCDKEFFPDGKVKSNFLCNIGYGNADELYPRSPRLDFDEACRFI